MLAAEALEAPDVQLGGLGSIELEQCLRGCDGCRSGGDGRLRRSVDVHLYAVQAALAGVVEACLLLRRGRLGGIDGQDDRGYEGMPASVCTLSKRRLQE